MTKKTNQDVEVVNNSHEETGFQVSNGVEQLISQAIDKKVSVETMERLLAMRRELKSEWAKEQYNISMAKFQSECPVIERLKVARDNEKNRDLYKYAPLDSIIKQTQELIAKHGFSYTFRQENDGIKVRVVCTVSHRFGHSEESIMETGLATKTHIMSGPQQIASTVTFNKRYAFCNILGIMTGDEDIDASKDVVEPPQPPVRAPVVPATTTKSPEVPKQSKYINKEQADEINALVTTLRIPKDARKRALEAIIERNVDDFKNITSIEAKIIIDDLIERVKRLKEAPEVNMVDPTINPPEKPPKETESYASRAINCETQEEAQNIIGEATLDKQMSDVKMRAIKNILINKGFNV